ncbi:MAG: hypothetical protein EAZ85_06820 [Bacteroidetes bacterium]|nr:MAG: hypothetical protein EAZ85_06820 [Bacteroidota bacterium]TAG89532.1 MAG: hypothetical protein EAZ20_06225 [Bacteroidota bacterium]
MNIKQKIIVFSAFFLIPFCAKSQYFAENEWHQGRVLLASGDTITGTLKYALHDEVVQVQVGNALQTFTPRKALNFSFQDRNQNRERQFYALPFAKTANYESPTFFEVVLQGTSITLLVRESWIQTTQYPAGMGGMGMGMGGMGMGGMRGMRGMPFTTYSVRSDFYFLYPDGRVKTFDGSKKRLLFLLKDKEKEIKLYLKQHNVRLNNTQELVRVLMYYNQIKLK